ncbi:MAG: GntR family transcriptional regulator, rspAB operon transcriptional repressor [Rhodospirillaceae bacterium]|jgi:DNA-binding GntR family transcriptional regulator|nr:GntR family transcriptional regulator, rspAB operon transcriptional repressor [Rhodospirillaceae bacterium]
MPRKSPPAPRRASKRRSATIRIAAASLPEDAQIDRAAPIPEQVYRILRHAILTLRMPPGAVIIEKEITDRLGISRTPVRDAIRQLADERLVNIKPQSGTYVALIDRHQLEEGRLIRRALEVEGIRLAAAHIDEQAIERLQDLVALQERAAAKGRHEAFIAYDDAFHQFISELSGHSRLWPIINRSKAHLDRVRYLSMPLPRQETTAIAQHRAIVEALARGGAERAAKVLIHHLDDAYDRLSIVLKQHAEMFG